MSYRTDDCLKRPTISTSPCPPTVAGPYAAWMPRKVLQGRTCGVSCEGGRARALQPNRRATALHVIHPHRPIAGRDGPPAPATNAVRRDVQQRATGLPAARPPPSYGNAGGFACHAAKTSARLARSASRQSGSKVA
ncbi:hypothetical protein XarbCFBP7408_16150 [Xanthomonas arboricola pv. guizotiae]|uniref:Uncharacterized protein n=1 Tax=Xanthomonas arboricola pv. guizotiae TaxID=487867 RepID=A0A2S6ZZQ6_9XANT|nr:hypothetical protein XarbCFBP7409_11955 [Xanthomonas arboricola pv. guizotiae]PPU21679.1 hypothetical protein XarbCFBP7408_16150 [Xanthomonas arboricola pv. guizotiae]